MSGKHVYKIFIVNVVLMHFPTTLQFSCFQRLWTSIFLGGGFFWVAVGGGGGGGGGCGLAKVGGGGDKAQRLGDSKV